MLHRRAGKTTAIINHRQRAALNDNWEKARLKRLEPAVTPAQLRALGGRTYGHMMPTALCFRSC